IGFSSETGVFRLAEKVRYSDEYPLIDFSNRSSPAVFRNQVAKAFYVKSVCWAYEHEWRSLKFASPVPVPRQFEDMPEDTKAAFREQYGPNLYAFPRSSVREVILGARIDSAYREQVMSWVAGMNVDVYQARVGQRKFEVVRSACGPA